MTGAGAGAGWYDDGATAGVVRWFDGTAWTEHTRPIPAQPTGVAGPASAAAVRAPAAVGPATHAAAHQHSPNVSHHAANPGPPPAAAPGYAAAAYAPVPTHAPGQAAAYGQPASYRQQPASFGQPASYGQPASFGQPAPYGQPAYAQAAPNGGSASFAQVAPYGGQVAQVSRFGGVAEQPSTFGQAYGAPFAVDDSAVIAKVRRRAAREFWFGLGLLLLGAAITTVAAASISASGGYGGGRHYVSTAGIIGGFLAFYRSRKHYKAMLELGGRPWKSSNLTLAVVVGALAALLAVVSSVHAFTATGSPAMGPAAAGSCWASSNGTAWQVPCSAAHAYRASGLIASGMPCPNATDMIFPMDDGSGSALCLTPDTTPTTSG